MKNMGFGMMRLPQLDENDFSMHIYNIAEPYFIKKFE